jgi:hypothetical protein
MRTLRLLSAAVTLTCVTAASAAAQTITLHDNSAARAGLRVGYGGHGVDWDTSIDSPLLADLVRFRGSVGHGRWDSEFDSYADPVVTRLGASALIFIRSRYDLRPYVGLGLSAYVPRGGTFTTRTGRRLIAGAEGSGERWTVGLEVEIDLPRQDEVGGHPSRFVPFVNNELFPAGRIGIAVRRRF